jgi:hypothetical protein
VGSGDGERRERHSSEVREAADGREREVEEKRRPATMRKQKQKCTIYFSEKKKWITVFRRGLSFFLFFLPCFEIMIETI